MTVLEKEVSVVTFTFKSNPEAKKVFLTGSFVEWDPKGIPMKKGKDKSFKVQYKLPPGRHEYKFIVDGVWVNDPNAEHQVKNSLGTYNSVVTIE